jgi:hypothetical protein
VRRQCGRKAAIRLLLDGASSWSTRRTRLTKAGSIFLCKPPRSSVLPEPACWCSLRHAVRLFAGHAFAILLHVCEVPEWAHLADIPCRSWLPLGRPLQRTNQSAMTWVMETTVPPHEFGRLQYLANMKCVRLWPSLKKKGLVSQSMPREWAGQTQFLIS